jgi:hypothetical protein
METEEWWGVESGEGERTEDRWDDEKKEKKVQRRQTGRRVPGSAPTRGKEG